jgi:hypothetical protein
MKKLTITILFMISTLSSVNVMASEIAPAKLQNSIEFIFEKVLLFKKLTHREDIPLPKIFFESTTSLKEYQDAVELTLGMRPDFFLNVFVLVKNEIYIRDDARYYKKYNRCIDDSIAHELAHYVQAKYQGWSAQDENTEVDAVEIQTAFREQFCKI